jgi:hypothetical protein
MKAAQSSTTCVTTCSSRSLLLAKWYEMTLLRDQGQPISCDGW